MMVFSGLPQAGMRRGFHGSVRVRLSGSGLRFGRFLLPAGSLILLRRSFREGDGDLVRIRAPECQLIAVDPELHGVPQGREPDQSHPRAGDDAHIQDVLAQGALSVYPLYDSGLSDLQFIQFHNSAAPCMLFFALCR